MRTHQEIESEIRDLLSSEAHTFRPCAWFDDQLDCIRILTRNSSVTEERVNKIFTLLRDNYPEAGQFPYVGITIKGASYICETVGLNPALPVEIASLLDRILAKQLADESFIKYVAKPIVAQLERKEIELQPAPA